MTFLISLEKLPDVKTDLPGIDRPAAREPGQTAADLALYDQDPGRTANRQFYRGLYNLAEFHGLVADRDQFDIVLDGAVV